MAKCVEIRQPSHPLNESQLVIEFRADMTDFVGSLRRKRKWSEQMPFFREDRALVMVVGLSGDFLVETNSPRSISQDYIQDLVTVV